MKRLNRTMLITITIIIGVSNHTVAQETWGVEFRPGVNFATGDLGNADLKTGFGFEGTLSYQFIQHLSGYAGWSWNKFGSDESFAGDNVDFEETGYRLGLQYMHPIPNSTISYLVRGGATYNHIETENDAGSIIHDTGHGLGWEAGAGIAFQIGSKWKLIPEVRYRSLSREIKTDNIVTPVDLNYFSFGVGLGYSF